LLTTASAGEVGNWDFGGKVSLVKIDSGYGVKAALIAEYRIMAMLTWRSDLEMLLRDAADLAKTDISIPSNLLYYPLQSQFRFDPYIGPGLTFTYTYTGSAGLGANILGGINFLVVKGKKFGIESKYTVPLIPKIKTGTFEIGLTGAWEIQF